MSQFTTHIIPPSTLTDPVLWFIFFGEEILLYSAPGLTSIPQWMDTNFLSPYISQQLYLGVWNTTHCFALSLDKAPESLPHNTFFQHIRQAHETLNNEVLFSIVSRAKQLLNWDKNTQFCGRCGQNNQLSNKERAKICSTCSFMTFPHISPAMLVLIWRENQLLLARSPHFMPGVYSILAGFVDPGESLEQTVVREVKEEVGITIKNLQYFGSQPWPFPSNLMLGFIAEYDNGELQFDPKELEDAQWFSLDKLPKLPKPISLSRLMIDDFLSRQL
ncbi:NAD(+) diphosphatase [Legionella quateirensis]|uniref:NAD(+) diphosphatase n=1 Tax=Legionella quateirensis TaxID=45072 RepID=A0A378KT44_9GAMM|nr:NAD(+) diphosphatase [Legionella quateirensis]KTD43663.1 NADH pyrophosphatase [Legionella quateirensis]STY17349.1 NADH pyrophosphatase [Legionella quateirensis]